MRVANADGRAVLVHGDGVVDIADRVGRALPADPQALYDHWDEVRALADGIQSADAAARRPQRCCAPVPRPRQVFAIGMNYAAHAAEAGVEIPTVPADVHEVPDLPHRAGRHGRAAERVRRLGGRAGASSSAAAPTRSPRATAGRTSPALTVGQDLSERIVQTRPPAPQFSLGKSFPGFGPTGPWVVTPDELDDPDDLALGCTVNGEEVQKSRTSDLIFGVDALINRLSSITPLLPGDLIFTGTPSGVGGTRTPPRFLAPGDELVSTIEGIGTIHTHLVAEEHDP